MLPRFLDAAEMRAEQDHYDVLGVRQDATADEIKRAFRRLVRTLHPDVAPQPPEGSFHDVLAAYEVLSHPRRRSLYDRFGSGGRRRPAARPAPAAPPLPIHLEWYEAERGASVPVELEERVLCATCAGRGSPPGCVPAVCARCRGAGRSSTVTESPTVRLLDVQVCAACRGVGHAPPPACPDCGGAGSAVTRRSLRIRTPAGVRDGDHIRVEGLDRLFRIDVDEPPRDSRPVLRLATVALLCALGLLLYLVIR